jgi:hypothetical protein
VLCCGNGEGGKEETRREGKSKGRARKGKNTIEKEDGKERD